MLNIITLTSIEATIPQTEINPCNNYQKSSFSDYIADSTIDDQGSENMQSVTNTTKSNENSTYFSIETHENEYFHLFQGVGEWVQLELDPKIHFYNQPEVETWEYLYCTKSNRIYNKPIVRISSQEYKSPTINMVVDNEVKIQIHVNDPQTEKFCKECIARGKFILFYNLIGNEREVYVSSLIFFFKYHGVIYCSIQQVEPGLTIEMVEDLIQQRWQDFIKDFVLRSFQVTPEYAVQQVEMILGDENCVTNLFNLEDAADFKENDNIRTTKEENKNRLPIVCVNKVNIYDEKYWQPFQTCNYADTCGHLYSVDDMMITRFAFPMTLTENKLPLIWKIIAQNTVNIFEIINPEIDMFFPDNIIRERVFTIYPIYNNQQTTPEHRDYVFFRTENEKMLFCVKFDDGQYQTVKDSDIHEILFILKTTNVFYFLTDNSSVHKCPLWPIIEESEVSSDHEGSNDNVHKYETEEENVLNLTDKERIINEGMNTSKYDLVEHTTKQEINEADYNLANKLNISFENKSNTTKEPEEIFNFSQKKFPSTMKKITTNSQDNISMNVCSNTEAQVSHKIGNQLLKLELLDEKVFMVGAVYLLDPITNLVSEDKILLSENSDVRIESIIFRSIGRIFKKVSLIEDIKFLENETNLHFTPFYFITKEDNEIRVKRILIFIYTGYCENLYCHAIKTNIHLEDLKELRIKDGTKYIKQMKGLPNIKSVKEIVMILKTTKLLETLQDKKSYTPFIYNNNEEEEVFLEQSENEIPQTAMENLQNDSSKILVGKSSEEESEGNGKNESKGCLSEQSNSLMNRIRIFFKNFCPCIIRK